MFEFCRFNPDRATVRVDGAGDTHHRDCQKTGRSSRRRPGDGFELMCLERGIMSAYPSTLHDDLCTRGQVVVVW